MVKEKIRISRELTLEKGWDKRIQLIDTNGLLMGFGGVVSLYDNRGERVKLDMSKFTGVVFIFKNYSDFDDYVSKGFESGVKPIRVLLPANVGIPYKELYRHKDTLYAVLE
jgi:hypothetical protein